MREALEAAGILTGEAFQVATILDRRIACATFVDPALAWAWVERSGAADLVGPNAYLCLNPVTPDLGSRRARADQVTAVRTLLLDVDPVGEDRRPAENLARWARDLLERHCGTRFPLVDSGRGYQLWVRHEETLAPHRAHLLRWFAGAAQVAGNTGATVDATHDASRLARLPGTYNRRTGRLAALLP